MYFGSFPFNVCCPKWGSNHLVKSKSHCHIAEGDQEPASIGSYSVAIFKTPELMDFISGGVFSRDGSIFESNGMPRILFDDITGDKNQEIIIKKFTAGSGNYVEVDVLRPETDSVKLLLRIKTIDNPHIIDQLRSAWEQSHLPPKSAPPKGMQKQSSTPLAKKQSVVL